MPKDNLKRWAFLSDDGTRARCDNCDWRSSPPLKPRTIAASARKHVRETGHVTRVFDTRVTVYSRAD